MAGPCCTGSSDFTAPPQPNKRADNKTAATIVLTIIDNPYLIKF
jgi:hypothetical protein